MIGYQSIQLEKLKLIKIRNFANNSNINFVHSILLVNRIYINSYIFSSTFFQ